MLELRDNMAARTPFGFFVDFIKDYYKKVTCQISNNFNLHKNLNYGDFESLFVNNFDVGHYVTGNQGRYYSRWVNASEDSDSPIIKIFNLLSPDCYDKSGNVEPEIAKKVDLLTPKEKNNIKNAFIEQVKQVKYNGEYDFVPLEFDRNDDWESFIKKVNAFILKDIIADPFTYRGIKISQGEIQEETAKTKAPQTGSVISDYYNLTSKFDELISKGNYPREELNKKAENWKTCGKRVLFIKGAHGTGKSHFVASLNKILHYSAYVFLNFNYCEWVKDDLLGYVANCIASQLGEKNAEYKKNLELFLSKNNCEKGSLCRDKNLYLSLICEPMKNVSDPFILLVDAVDEAPDPNELNKFLVLILRACGNIRLVVTSTDDLTFDEFPYETLCLEDNKEDVNDFINQKAPDAGFNEAEIRELIKYADGNYKFAEFAINNKIKDYTGFSDSADFESLYGIYFNRSGINPNDIPQEIKLIFALIVLQMNSIQNIIKICGKQNWEKFKRLFKGLVTIKSDFVHLFHYSVANYVMGLLNEDDIDGAKNKCEKFQLNIIDGIIIDNVEGFTIKNCSKTLEAYEFLKRIGRLAEVNKDISRLYKIQYSAYLKSDKNLSIEKQKEIEDLNNWGVVSDDLSYDIYVRSLITLFETYSESGESQKAHGVLQKLSDSLLPKNLSESSDYIYNRLTSSTKLYFITNYCWDSRSRTNLELLENELETAVKNAEFWFYKSFYFYLSAKLNYSEGNYEDCKNDCDRAKNIAENYLDQSNSEPFCVLILNQKGWSEFHLNNYEEALSLFEESHKIRLKIYGEFSRYTALAKDALVRVKIKIAETENKKADYKASELAQDALETNINLFGENNPRTARSYITKALLHNANSEFSFAIECLTKAKNIFQAGTSEYATCCQLLGDTILKDPDFNATKLKKAIDLYNECLKIREKDHSPHLKETENAIQRAKEKLAEINLNLPNSL